MSRKALVLYAEDDLNDVLLCKYAVQHLGWNLDIQYVPDGQAALEWLAGEGMYEDRDIFPLPSVLVTDLKMPKVDGFELIKQVRSSAQFKDLPIIVFSSLSHDAEAKKAIALGATRYVPKSMQMDPLMECLRGLLNR